MMRCIFFFFFFLDIVDMMRCNFFFRHIMAFSVDIAHFLKLEGLNGGFFLKKIFLMIFIVDYTKSEGTLTFL